MLEHSRDLLGKATDQATSKSGVHRNLQLATSCTVDRVLSCITASLGLATLFKPSRVHAPIVVEYSRALQTVHDAGGESSLRSTLVSNPKLQATLRRCESVMYESSRMLLLSLMVEVMITATYELFRCKNMIYTASLTRPGVC
jgi:hypothetical protein